MKLKYKKTILLAALSTMGIGLLTISINNSPSLGKEVTKPSKSVETGVMSDNEDTKSATPTIEPTTTVAATPTVVPVYNLQKDADKNIKNLFVSFYKAKNNRDIESIKKLLSDSTKVDSKDDLKKKTQYIESYDKIATYAKKGNTDGTYIVYVYHEIKFAGISTAAPGLSKFYVITDSNKELKIFSGDMDEKTKKYYDDRNNDDDVKAIIDMTNTKSDAAIKKDADLKNFWKNIDKLANKASGESNVATKSPTKAPESK